MNFGLTAKVMSLGKKKDEIMETICDVHINPMDMIDKCGEVAISVPVALTDTTCAIGKGLCKTFRKQTSNATVFVREVKECVDPEDMLKSLYHLGKEDSQKNQNLVHTPIDWSKRSPLPQRSTAEAREARNNTEESISLSTSGNKMKDSLYASHNNVNRCLSHEEFIDRDNAADDNEVSINDAQCFQDVNKNKRTHSRIRHTKNSRGST